MSMTTCPKCSSKNIYTSENGIGWKWEIMVRMVIGMDVMNSTKNWETRLCADCGYYETYLTDKDWLAKIKAGEWKNWKKVE